MSGATVVSTRVDESGAEVPWLSTLRALGRVMGVVAIVVGAVVIGFNPNRWDVVILTLPRDHGIHLRDVAGMMLLTLGIAVLWHSRRWR